MATNRTRPRGFMENWKPRQETLVLVNSIRVIMEENSDIAPLTLRQIFYMLVSNNGYDKTELAYKRLCETMTRARRAQFIDMDGIRDDGLRRETPEGWDSEEEALDAIRATAERFRLNRQAGQGVHTMVWCEAGGMLPQLANYCRDYGVTVLSSGGFDSVTTKHNFAKEASEIGDVEILHIGDHDPSGVHMCSSLDEDLSAFADYFGGTIEVTRLAVIPDQIEAMGLATSPRKATDNRKFAGETTQAEAIPPRRLKEIVQAALKDRIDLEIYNQVLDLEKEIKLSLAAKLADL